MKFKVLTQSKSETYTLTLSCQITKEMSQNKQHGFKQVWEKRNCAMPHNVSDKVEEILKYQLLEPSKS